MAAAKLHGEPMITLNVDELQYAADKGQPDDTAVVTRRWLRAIHFALTHPSETMLLKDGSAPVPMVTA